MEVSANVSKLISIIDPRLSKFLSNKDSQLCASFVGFRECQDLFEQMVCATSSNPDSGNYLELPPGEVGLMRVCSAFAQKLYDTCKDLPLPGFQGAISMYFSTAEKLMTLMFGRVAQAFDKLKYNVQVIPTNEGTDKCYNGPKQIPKINVCCDPLPATPDCPLENLNVSMNPEYGPFVGRTIADPTCPAQQSAGGSGPTPSPQPSVPPSPALSVPPSPASNLSPSSPPPKRAPCMVASRVLVNVLVSAACAFAMLL
ncbi:hypothetical protein CLOM_g13409 [Closterium sp. NIES-68]|nr:hypothetical protein CLOM_g13409 [Closterium sp. NIES-68]GJP72422.1 hypothetical protein CLOP_g3157 [Closterium sp. NIES-67]